MFHFSVYTELSCVRAIDTELLHMYVCVYVYVYVCVYVYVYVYVYVCVYVYVYVCARTCTYESHSVFVAEGSQKLIYNRHQSRDITFLLLNILFTVITVISGESWRYLKVDSKYSFGSCDFSKK